MLARRSLLQAAAAAAAARFLEAGRAEAAPAAHARLERDPFALGVASGEPARDGFVLWTRAVGQSGDVAVGYEVAEDEGFRRIVRRGRALASAARAGAVHLEIGGLNPGRPYWYRFHLGGAVSRIGRCLTTAAAPQRARFALTACQHWEQGWFSAYRDILARDVDAVFQVGDYIYEKSFGSGPDVRRFGAPIPTTLADFRARHALYRTDPDLAAAHAALPFIVTFDDHEVENDYAGAQGVAHADDRAFARLRTAAYQAYFEHMPLRPSALLAGGGLGLHRRIGWGDLATLHVLDTRQHRTGLVCPTPEARGGHILESCPALDDPAWTMLGHAQEDWLRAGLAAEQGRWSLVAQQTLFSRLYLPGGDAQAYSDIWDAFPSTRDRTLAALAQPAVRNAVVLGGDVHSFWVNDIKRDFTRGASPIVATELVTSCLASHNGPEALFGPAPGLNPHVRYLDNAHAGYVLIELTPKALSADIRAVTDLTDPASSCASLARYTVEDGRPGAVS